MRATKVWFAVLLACNGFLMASVRAAETGDSGRWGFSLRYWYAFWHIHEADGTYEDAKGIGMLGAMVSYTTPSRWQVAAGGWYGEYEYMDDSIPRWDFEAGVTKAWRTEDGVASVGVGWRLWHLDSPIGVNILGVKDDPWNASENFEIVFGPMLNFSLSQRLGKKWGVYGALSVQPYLWMESNGQNDEKDYGEGYNAEAGAFRVSESGHSFSIGYRGQRIRGGASEDVSHVADWFHGLIVAYSM